MDKSMSTLAHALFPPAESPKYALEIMSTQGRRWRRWVQHPDEIEPVALAESAGGHNVYWRIAQYGTTENAKEVNAEKIGVIAFDIDIRDYDEHHRTWDKAGWALVKFIDTFNLPRPFVVDSGGGMHVYWPLTAALKPEPWRRVAKAMVAAAQSTGLQVDAGVCVNPVTLLRVPGTMNHKYGKTVTQRMEGVAVHPSELVNKIDAFFQKTPVPKSPLAAFTPAITNGPASALKYPIEDVERSLEEMCRKCPQMKHGPSAAEPVWRAGLSVIRVFKDWREAAHTWSARDMSAYDEEVTDTKLDHLEELPPMPTKCSTFDRLNPGVCSKCAYYGAVGSPIVLSVVKNTAASGLATAEEAQVKFTPTPLAADTLSIETPASPGFAFVAPPSEGVLVKYEGLPFMGSHGYFTDEDGVPFKEVTEVDKKTGERVHVTNLRLFDGTVHVVARVDTTHAGTREDAVVIDFGFKGERIRVVPPISLIATHTDNAALFRYLGNYGIISPIPSIAKEFATWLRVAVSEALGDAPKLSNTEALGWSTRGFVVGEEEVRADGSVAPAWLVGSAHTRARHYARSGTVAGWSVVPETYKRQGNMEAQFALMQSFASPLMPMTGENGLLVHLTSADSGTGKSTLLQAINSVWGDGAKLMMTARDTANSTAKLFTIAQNLPATIDELTNLDPKAVSDLAFAATQGTQKNRLTQGAELREAGNWSLIAITTGNESLRAKLSLNGRSDSEAENMRIIELTLPLIRNHTPEESEAIQAAIRDNPGVAGMRYARWLTHNKHLVHKAVSACRTKWMNKLTTKSAERFWVASIAATEVAFHLSKQIGLHDLDWDAMETWIIDKFMVRQRSQTQTAVEEHASTDFIDGLLAETNANTLVTRCSVGARGVFSDGAGSAGFALVMPKKVEARLERDTGTLYLSRAAVRAYAADKGIPRTRIEDLLTKASGYKFVAVTRIRIAAGTDFAGSAGRVICYKLVAVEEMEGVHDDGD